MKTFILIASGWYDNTWSKVIIACRNQEKLEAVMAEMIVVREFVRELLDKLDTFNKTWAEQNPFDNSQLKSEVKIPRWDPLLAGRLITDEMRAERKRLQSINEEIAAHNSKVHGDYRDRARRAEMEFLEVAGLFNVIDKKAFESPYVWVIRHKLYNEYVDVHYEIEEIEEIECL